jgi:hypothetical protein
VGRRPNLNGSKKSVLACLLDCANGTTGQPGAEYVSVWTGLPPRTVERSVQPQAKGIVRVIPRKLQCRSNIYIINWQSLFSGLERVVSKPTPAFAVYAADEPAQG